MNKLTIQSQVIFVILFLECESCLGVIFLNFYQVFFMIMGTAAAIGKMIILNFYFLNLSPEKHFHVFHSNKIHIMTFLFSYHML